MPNLVTLDAVTTLPTALVSSPEAAPDAKVGAGSPRRVDLPLAAVVLMCAWWLIAAPRMWGGRDAGAITLGAVATAVAVCAIRPQRYLPARYIWLALAMSAGALGVALTSPTGWAGAATAASYVAVAWTVIAVAAAVVRDRRVADVLLLLTCVGVLVEVAEAWLPWWGGSDPTAPMIGTFYWHDPFAAFLIAGSVVGLSFWLRRRGVFAVLGLLSAALGTIGLVYSTSRASVACYALAVVVLLVVELARHRLAGVRRAAVALLVGGAAVWTIAGPPFFSHRAAPFAGTGARSAGQSLSQNGGYRMDFWHEAIGVFSRHPVTGGGYHSLATASAGHVPSAWPLSPLAHNGYLQALSDGGLLLGIPFLLAVAVVCGWVVASLWSALRERDFSTLQFALPLALGALLAHSLVDFDWSYAADFAMVAVLAGLLGGSRLPAARPARSARSSRILAGAVLAGVALTGVTAAAAWSGDLRQSLPISASANIGSAR